jgi:hypothetical protein
MSAADHNARAPPRPQVRAPRAAAGPRAASRARQTAHAFSPGAHAAASGAA